MLGDRIRKLRQELGLSQQQLAGKEMTRAFISLVESNKSTPSPETLRIIAQRLGKTVEFLSHAADAEESEIDLVVPLIDSAERELEKELPEAVKVATRRLEQAIKRLEGTDRADLLGKARALLVTCLQRQGKHEEAVEEAALAVVCYKALNDVRGLARLYCSMGASAFHLEDYPRARQAFEQAALYCSGLKNMQSFRATVLSYLGTTLHRLGQYEESIARHKEALEECPPQESKEQWGNVAMGLGWVLFRCGSVTEAYQWTTKAQKALKEARSPLHVMALHNLAIMDAARQNWETAYVGFQECLKVYREQGKVSYQASLMEEIAQYWVHRGELARAETTCWEAIDLLDLQDNGILRGRLYRLLGKIALTQRQVPQAHSMLRVSYELLRRLKSTAEATLSFEELQKVRELMVEGDSSADRRANVT